MSALLTGVNRAFPYAALEPTQLDQQLGVQHHCQVQARLLGWENQNFGVRLALKPTELDCVPVRDLCCQVKDRLLGQKNHKITERE